MELDELVVGSRIKVIPRGQLSSKNWIADFSNLAAGWTCELVPRHDYEITDGVPVEVWILDVDYNKATLSVSGSDRGFEPITDAMRPRYVAALRRVESALQSGALREQDADFFSDVKGMFNRVVKRDQSDWFAVYIALGRPTRERARLYATRLRELSRCLKRSNHVEAEALLSRLDDGEFLQIVSRACQAISEAAPPLPAPSSIDRVPETGVSDRRARRTMSDDQKSKLDSATATHEETLGILRAYLADSGHQIESNKFVDAFCRLKSGPALFEVKSITDATALHQVRAALAQLYEYRFRHQISGASLWVVLSQRPTRDAWLVDYLETDRDIRVLWVVDRQLSGPSIERLLESGSASLRRRRSSPG